jgi:hypothetical protein
MHGRWDLGAELRLCGHDVRVVASTLQRGLLLPLVRHRIEHEEAQEWS